ncbi:MAG: hypothetical protein ABIH09_01945 [Candidatus Omnitrophota bacterium]
MANKKFRRKRYIVLVGFQLKYILYILLFIYIGAAVAGYTVYWTTWVTLGEKLANVYPRSRLVYIFHDANMALIIRMLLITPIFVIIGIFLSHRIAGPIYRINKYLDSLKEGDYSRDIKLRKKDELKDVAGKLTELCQELRKKKEQKDIIIKEIEDTLDKSGVSSDVSEKIKAEVRQLS